MKIALVGNNNGPLILLKSMLERDIYPVCVGLQKAGSEQLISEYGQFIDATDLFSGFDESGLLHYLKNYDVDLLINCFCNFKFDRLLERYEVLNVHLAPLPKYRGRHPMHWALINGESVFGVTIHRMDEGFDSGAILWQKMIPVVSGMSVAALRQALMGIVQANFGGFLEDYQKGSVETQLNDDAYATYAPRRYPEDSRLTEWQDGAKIFRKIMALSSEQNPAFLRINNKDVPVIFARLKDVHLEEKKELASIHQIEPRGVEILCTDGKIVGLYGFRPEKYGIKQNQKIT